VSDHWIDNRKMVESEDDYLASA